MRRADDTRDRIPISNFMKRHVRCVDAMYCPLGGGKTGENILRTIAGARRQIAIDEPCAEQTVGNVILAAGLLRQGNREEGAS